MKNKVFNYLLNYSTQPYDVDRLIISAYHKKSKVTVKKNEFLDSFIIKEKNIKEYDKLIKFISIIEEEIENFGIEELIELFEFVVSPADRVINGAVYTPSYIREYIVRQSFDATKNKIESARIADISCGCGGFLYSAAKELKRITKKSYFDIFKNQIFGLDIQPYSITRTKLLLSILALSEGEDRKEFHFNLFVGDALDFDWGKTINRFSGFDIIVGNPPYVCSRNLSEETKMKLSKWTVSNSGHPDLYIPFFQIGIEGLALGGALGFITMNSFFRSLNGRAVREFFQRSSLKFKIIDFGSEQIFTSRNTYTCICLIEKRAASFIKYYKSENSKELSKQIKSFNKISYTNLDSKKGWSLQSHEIISRIESTGRSFGQLYQTRNGIATLKNDIYIFNPIDEDSKYYYLQNGNVYQIEKDICRDIVNSNKLRKVENVSKLKERIIFPYTDVLKPRAMEEGYLKKNFPKAYNYLENKKNILAGRDKGKGVYENWFAFGRTQSLEKIKHKLFFPHITDKNPNYIINSDDNLFFYNGLAVVGQSRSELVIVKKLMETRLFWFYIEKTSKPYTSGYFSLSSNYIRNFGICDLDNKEREFVTKEQDRILLDKFFEKKYDVEIS